MNRLEKLSNTDKATILHQLFPEEIPALIQFIDSLCETFQEEQERMRHEWGPTRFEQWLSMAISIRIKINRNRLLLTKSSFPFADQLFAGKQAEFLNYCLHIYATTIRHPNRKFGQMISILFL